MKQKWDVIVVGQGAMGCAASYHLAKRGCRVLGLEQFHVGHDRGSSHGESRIIRRAYFEHPDYVPLLFRAYELWDELAAEAREELLVRNGVLIMGRPGKSPVFTGTLESGERYGIPLETLSAAEVQRRFPAYQPAEGLSGVLEPGAGFLRVERANRAHARIAKERGAEIREGETVREISPDGAGFRVQTNQGIYFADRLVVAGGGWNSELLGPLRLPLELHRLIQCWFPAGGAHGPAERVPCFIHHEGERFVYGFPSLDGASIKIASHYSRARLDRPEEKDVSEVPADQLRLLQDFVARNLPHARPELLRFAPCIYTMTPDEHFVLDRHPEHPGFAIAAGFSGHGFKFASVVGEALADLAIAGQTRLPISFLGLGRPGLQRS